VRARPAKLGVAGADSDLIDAVWRQRTQHAWGLMEWVKFTCRRFKVHRLLIEAKGPEQSAAQELSHRFGISDFVVDATPVKSDKVARALAVQANFANGMIYAPKRGLGRAGYYGNGSVSQGRHDDLTGSTTQAIRYLRDNGLLRQWMACGTSHNPSLFIPASSTAGGSSILPFKRAVRGADYAAA
jgi:hypothetical protein